MKYAFFVFLLLQLCSSPALNGQTQDDYITISGQLQDQKSKEPLSFASIYLLGTTVGTTSNTDGEFIFHIPSDVPSDTVVISLIGYNTLKKKLTDIAAEEVFLLEQNTVELTEVVVTDEKRLTAKEIVQKAYRALPQNYPSEPYILEGFVRDLQNEDDKYVEYMECAVKMQYQKYNLARRPKVELQAVRRSYIAEKHPWNKGQDRKNTIVDIVEDEFIRYNYGPIRAKKGWKYEIESVLPFDGRFVYRITAVDKPFQTAVLYIDTESFAFVRLELTRQAKGGRSWQRRLASGQKQVYYNVIFEYQEHEGKMYLKYQKEEDSWKVYKNAESPKLLFVQNPKKELFINKVITKNVAQYDFKPNLDITESVEEQAPAYDAAFWQYYNIPAQTKELSQIETYLKSVQLEMGEKK